jgi:hypothetical protein
MLLKKETNREIEQEQKNGKRKSNIDRQTERKSENVLVKKGKQKEIYNKKAKRRERERERERERDNALMMKERIANEQSTCFFL